jgi:adenosylmethionine-8-amino-7-oxononanoate aminotransferase
LRHFERRKTLFYGHSYTGNALGCAGGKGKSGDFRSDAVVRRLAEKIELLAAELDTLRSFSSVAEVRQLGFIAAVELVSSEPGLGARVCIAARRWGLLTRPIKNVIVLMPPYCITADEIRQAVAAIRNAIAEVAGPRGAHLTLADA